MLSESFGRRRNWVWLLVWTICVAPGIQGTVFGQEDDPFSEDPFGDFQDFDGGHDPFGDCGADEEFAQDFDPFGDDESSKRTSQPKPRKGKKSTSAKSALSSRLKQLGFHGLGDETEAEIRIMESLEEKTELEFVDEPLAFIFQVIKERHEIPVHFDTNALEDESLDPTSDIASIDVSGIKLKNALVLMLDRLSLTYLVRNEVLVITSKNKAEETLITRMYRIAENWEVDEEDFADTILRMVGPDSWDSVGGPGAIKAVPGGLFVSNTASVHRDIEKVCAKLDVLYAE